MLLLIYQDLKEFIAGRENNQVYSTTQGLLTLHYAFTFIIEFYGIHNRVLLAGIMAQVDKLIFKGFQGNLYFITILGKKTCSYECEGQKEEDFPGNRHNQ